MTNRSHDALLPDAQLRFGRESTIRPTNAVIQGRSRRAQTLLLKELAACVVICLWMQGASSAQTDPQMTFEVASVKPSGPADRLMYRLQPGGRYIATALTLKILIANAYGVPEYRVAGGPPWRDSDKFNIEAKVGIPLMPWPDRDVQLNEMLRSLLEERFKLATHREIRQETVYKLVVAKSGSKLRLAQEGEKPVFGIEPGSIRSTAVSLDYLAGNLSSVFGRTVVDETGLAGKFDYLLSYAPDGAGPVDNRPSLFTAIEEQLGLRLESTRGPVEFVVIDHAEKLAAN